MTLEEQIKELHGTYCRLTGVNLPFSQECQFRWEVFIKWGHYNVRDLEVVIAYLRKRIRKGERRQESFRFNYLVGDLERFAEDLSFATAEARKPVVSAGRAEVLRATGRPVEQPTRPARSINQIMNSPGFKELMDLRDKLRDKLR